MRPLPAPRAHLPGVHFRRPSLSTERTVSLFLLAHPVFGLCTCHAPYFRGGIQSISPFLDLSSCQPPVYLRPKPSLHFAPRACSRLPKFVHLAYIPSTTGSCTSRLTFPLVCEFAPFCTAPDSGVRSVLAMSCGLFGSRRDHPVLIVRGFLRFAPMFLPCCPFSGCRFVHRCGLSAC